MAHFCFQAVVSLRWNQQIIIISEVSARTDTRKREDVHKAFLSLSVLEISASRGALRRVTVSCAHTRFREDKWLPKNVNQSWKTKCKHAATDQPRRLGGEQSRGMCVIAQTFYGVLSACSPEAVLKVRPCWLGAVVVLVHLRWRADITPACLFGYELFFFRATTDCLRNAQSLSLSVSVCVWVCEDMLNLEECTESWRGFLKRNNKVAIFSCSFIYSPSFFQAGTDWRRRIITKQVKSHISWHLQPELIM